MTLMVANFWGVETRGAGLRACAASTDYGAGLIQEGAHENLKSMSRGPATWSHVEGGAGV